MLQDFDSAAGEADDLISVEAAMQTLVRKDAEVLIAPYSSGLTARAAVAVSKAAAAQFAVLATGGDDDSIVGGGGGKRGAVVWPRVPTMLSAGAAAESVYTCDAAMEYPCSRPFGRRFRNVFTLMSPGATYFQGLVELAAAQKAAGIALLYETGGYSGNPFSKSVSNGVRVHAAKLEVNILIEVGVTIDPDANETTVTIADDAAVGTLDAPTTTTTNNNNEGGYQRLVIVAPDQIAAATAVADTLRPVVQADANKVVDLGGSGVQGGVVIAAATQKEISCEHLLAVLTEQSVAPASIGLTICSTKADFPTLLQSLNTSFVTGPSQWDAKLRGPDYEESAATSSVYHFASETGVPPPNKFLNEFEERWNGAVPTYHTAAVMAAAYMLEDAVKATGAFSLSGLGIALHNVRMPSFWGALHFNTLGVNEARAMVTYQYDFDHIARIVAPAAASNMPFVYPIPNQFDICPPGWEPNPNAGTGGSCDDEGEDEAANAATAAGNISSTSMLLNRYSGFCTSACRPCQAGTISPTAGSMCLACPATFVQLLAGKSACNKCSLNAENNADFTECIECSTGWQRSKSQDVCTELREDAVVVGSVVGACVTTLLIAAAVVKCRAYRRKMRAFDFKNELERLKSELQAEVNSSSSFLGAGAGPGFECGGGVGDDDRDGGGDNDESEDGGDASRTLAESPQLKMPREIKRSSVTTAGALGHGAFGEVRTQTFGNSKTLVYSVQLCLFVCSFHLAMGAEHFQSVSSRALVDCILC